MAFFEDLFGGQGARFQEDGAGPIPSAQGSLAQILQALLGAGGGGASQQGGGVPGSVQGRSIGQGGPKPGFYGGRMGQPLESLGLPANSRLLQHILKTRNPVGARSKADAFVEVMPGGGLQIPGYRGPSWGAGGGNIAGMMLDPGWMQKAQANKEDWWR